MVLKFLRYLPSLIKELTEEKFHDIADDKRLESEKVKDYIYGKDVILPMGKTGDRITKLKFKAYNQGQTGACGAFSAAHMRKIEESKDVEPLLWYRARSNYPYPGMFAKDVLELASFANAINTGGLGDIKPTEEKANSMKLLDLFKNKRKGRYEYAQFAPYNTDAVIDGVSNGHAVLIGFFSTLNEWRDEMYVRDYTTLFTARVRHWVVALPNSYHTKDGYDWVSVIDSSPQYGFSLRHIRIDFLKERMYMNGGFYYPVKTKSVNKIKTLPTKRCQFGQRSGSVLDLQIFLRELGLLSSIHTTSYYGPITAKAVLGWQLSHFGGDHQQLIKWGGNYWGPLSITKVNELYS